MSGAKNPIKLSLMDIQKLKSALESVDDLDYELKRMLDAGLDVEERTKNMLDMRRKIEGMIKIYGT